MSLRQIADVAYSMLVDQVEARANVDRLVTAFALVMGADVELVDAEGARERFDAALVAAPADVDGDRAALMRDLGIGG